MAAKETKSTASKVVAALKPKPAAPKVNPEKAALEAEIARLQPMYDEAWQRRSGIRQRYKNQIAACQKALAKLESS